MPAGQLPGSAGSGWLQSPRPSVWSLYTCPLGTIPCPADWLGGAERETNDETEQRGRQCVAKEPVDKPRLRSTMLMGDRFPVRGGAATRPAVAAGLRNAPFPLSRLVALSFSIAIVTGCGTLESSERPSQLPTPSATRPDATSLPSEAVLARLTPYPPASVADSIVERMRIGLAPLSLTDGYQVVIDAATATRTALASRGVGNPGPNATGEIEWTETGFVYLVKYTPVTPLGPTVLPYPAYLVQVMAPAIPGFPGDNTALVIVDARTGDLGVTLSTCVGVLCGLP